MLQNGKFSIPSETKMPQQHAYHWEDKSCQEFQQVCLPLMNRNLFSDQHRFQIT